MYNRKRKATLTLTQHANGYWCKKIEGKLRYFGARGGSEEDARKELIAYLHARALGIPETPAKPSSRDPELHQLAAAYQAIYAGRIAEGHVQQRTWDDYNLAITDFVARVGPRRKVSEITEADFSAVAGKWRVLPASTRGNYIQTIRSMFLWAKIPAEYGPDFHKPAKSDRRHERTVNPNRRLFSQDDLACMWRYASRRQRLFLLLGLNAGMYAKDIAEVRWKDLREVNGVLTLRWRRPKTLIPWIAPLWPETIAALPKRGQAHKRVLTTTSGQPLVRMVGKVHIDEVARATDRLLRRLGIKRSGVSFGAVRHTHTTATQGAGDVDAAKLCRGHVLDGMAELYDHVDEPEEFARLIAVSDRARHRLLVEPSGRPIPPAVIERLAARKPGRPRNIPPLAPPARAGKMPAPGPASKPSVRRN